MTSQQKIDLTLRAALMVKEASELINCSDPYIIRLTVLSVEEKLVDLQKKSVEYSNEKPK